jgi:peptidoglycan-associated lipoprotein
MKFSKLEFNKFNTLILIGLILPLASTGCRKKPGSLTPLPGSKAGAVKEPEPAPPVGPDIAKVGDDQIAKGLISNDPDSHKGWIENAELFKSDIVHFDFDSSVVKASEKAKVSNVADYLKGHSADAVRVEGNCDERGTEEYNRSLGERRALALREELVRLGIDPKRADTISYGEDKPVDPGHDEAAWRKNRRGEFILLSPPK